VSLIRAEHLARSVADALQYISYYHPRDYLRHLARAYERGKALNTATHFEIDDVIDPAESRHWVLTLLRSVPPAPPRTGKKRPCIDTW